MKYVSIDIETMGLHPECSVIEFAAVIDDGRSLSDLPTFHGYVGHKIYRCEPQCFEMHKNKLCHLIGATPAHELYERFVDWLCDNQVEIPFTAAGKNFASFDAPRIEALPCWSPGLWRHRTLDPSVLYLEPGDDTLPGTAVCLERAGLCATESHTALGDALDVVRLLRHKL